MPPELHGRAEVVARVVETVAAGTGTVVVGPAGSGRSAVLDAVVRALPTRQAAVWLKGPGIDGTRAAASLLPGDEGVVSAGMERFAALQRGIEALGEGGGDGRPLVVVDDIDRLDEGSLALLHRSLLARRVVLLAAACLDHDLPEDVTVLWKDHLVERVDLGPLGRVDADAVLEDLLGGPVQGATRERLWRLTGGNPLHLSEAVTSGLELGRWHRRGGLWCLDGGAAQSPSLTETVAARLERASVEARHLFDCLCLAESLPVAVAEDLVGTEVLTSAERQGLIEARHRSGQVTVHPAHPLAAQTRRDALTAEERAGCWNDLADVLLAHALDADGEVVLAGPALAAAAQAVLAAGRTDPAVTAVLRAAADGLLGTGQRSLAIAAGLRLWDLWRDPVGVSRAIAALGILGRHDEVEQLFDQVWAAATDDEQRFRALNAVAINLFHARNRPEAAIDLLARNPLGDPLWAGLVDTYLARLHFFRGDLARAEALVEPLVESPLPDVALDAAIVRVPLLTARGRQHEARQLTDAAFGRALGSEVDGSAPGTLVLFGLAAQIDQGEVAEAEAGLLALEPLAAGSGDATAYGWITLFLGRTALLRGHLRPASRWFRESVAASVELARPGWASWPAAGLVACLAATGRLDEAERARLHPVLEPGSHAVRLFALEADRLLVWDAVARGREVRPRLLPVIERAEEIGHLPLLASLWHDLARFDALALDRAAEALADLAGRCDSSLVDGYAAAAGARACGSVADLEGVAARFEEQGLDLDAAECWACVADRRTGRAATAATRRASELVRRTGGLQTPLLAAVPEAASSTQALTGREREVLELLAAGSTRQEVADRLFVSVRTVDSHLQRMYRKLGVRTREELVAALGPT